MQISKRLKAIPPYIFAEIGKRAAAAVARGVDVINLGIGDPDQPTPKHIVEAMHKAIDDPKNHHYPPFGGTPQYRKAAAQWCNQRFGIDINPDNEIVSLIGSKEGIHNLILAYIDEGDIALIPDPGYPVYRSSVTLAGGTSHFLPLTAKNKFLPDLDSVPNQVADKAKLMLINYPNNPTAAVTDIEFFEKAVAFCKHHDILLCHDLAYSEMCFDGYRAPSVFEVSGAKDIAIELHSLSKTYNMTGWRIGFAIGNAEAVKSLAQLKSNVDTDVFGAIQMAAIAAFDGPTEHITYCNGLYTKRRDTAVAALKRLGWNVTPNKATFYMWLPVPPGMTSVEFSSLMFDKASIVVPPGTAYGPGGEGYFRISLCVEESRLIEAFERMEKHGITYTAASKVVA